MGYRIFAGIGDEELDYEVDSLDETELAKTVLDAADRFRDAFPWITGGDIYVDVYKLEDGDTLVIDPIYMDFVSF